MPITGKSVIGLDFIAFLREAFTGTPKDDIERMILELNSLVEFAMDRRNATDKVLERIAKAIQRLFEFKTISVGIRDNDGNYRYVVFVGHTLGEEEALRKMKYNLNDMIDYDKYPNIRLGKIAQYHPVEAFANTEEELKSFGYPHLPDAPRKVLNQFLPGDYIDFYMQGFEGKLTGWFELSNTKNNKMPARSSIRWIELITDMTALIIQLRKYHEKEP